jgi:hypothetical protein
MPSGRQLTKLAQGLYRTDSMQLPRLNARTTFLADYAFTSTTATEVIAARSLLARIASRGSSANRRRDDYFRLRCATVSKW